MNELKEHAVADKVTEALSEYVETDLLQQNNQNQECDEEASQYQKKTIYQRCALISNNITVEPSIILFIIAIMITIQTTQNLYIDKACKVNLNFTDEICDSLRNQNGTGNSEYEKTTQKLIASAMAWKTYLTATIPTLMSLLVGSWSDKTGKRKIFIIITLAGATLACINDAVNVYFFYQLRLEVLVFSEGILEALYGGWCLMFLAVFSYISAITTDDQRTFRMGLINFSMTVGFPIGMGLSGVLLKSVGYYGCYAIAAGIHMTNLLYNGIVLRDPERSVDQKMHDDNFFRTFFDLRNIKDTIRVVFKKGENNRRLRVCILLAVVTFLFGPFYGEISIMYIATRLRFSWDEVQFSLFQSYSFVTHTVGTVFSITVFSKYLQWHDSMLGIISTLSKIAGSFVYCFAPNDKIFYLAPLVEILNGTSLLAMRSIVSKLVATDELGKVNSIFSLTENLMPLLYVPLYTKVYSLTMDVLPGAVFLMGSMMTLPAVAVFIWLFCEHRKIQRVNRRLENAEKES